MFTPNIGEEKTEEMKSEFEDIERAVFSHANGLRAKTYLHAKQTQISQVGFDFLLVRVSCTELLCEIFYIA